MRRQPGKGANSPLTSPYFAPGTSARPGMHVYVLLSHFTDEKMKLRLSAPFQMLEISETRETRTLF